MMSPASGNKDKVPGTPLIPPSLDEDCVYEGGEPPSHDSGIICQTPVAGKKDSVDAVVLSPMHPPRPLVHIREDQESDEDVGNENHPTDTAAAGGGEKGWVGRQVDALFSPVLNFLHGEEEDHGHHHLHQHQQQQHHLHNHQNHVHQPRHSLEKPSDGESTTNTSMPDKTATPSDTSLTTTSHDEEEEEEEEEDEEEEEAEEEDHLHHPHHQHHNRHEEDPDNVLVEEDGSSTGSVDDEDEFNPYIFIKSLPAYDLVKTLRPPIALPPKKKNSPPISLVLDLDETLVHCTVEPVDDADLVFPVVFHGMTYQVHVRLRPHLFTFLEKIKGKFEVIVFTASQKVYANELLNLIDPDDKYFHHRMFRESCLAVEGNFLKDLNVLGRDLAKCVLVDNSPHAFGYQVDNGIPIESWFDDPNDTELLKLERFLRALHNVDDVRSVVRSKFQTYRLVQEA